MRPSVRRGMAGSLLVLLFVSACNSGSSTPAPSGAPASESTPPSATVSTPSVSPGTPTAAVVADPAALTIRPVLNEAPRTGRLRPDQESLPGPVVELPCPPVRSGGATSAATPDVTRPGAATTKPTDVLAACTPVERLLLGPATLTATDVAWAEPTGMPANAPVMHAVLVNLTPEGAEAFATFTREQAGQRVAVLVGDTVMTAPIISAPITGGALEITGQFTAQQAQDLAEAINAGRASAPTG